LIDLHSHTTESDGTDSPEELIAIAVRAGLEALAITDHDTLSCFAASNYPLVLKGAAFICWGIFRTGCRGLRFEFG